MLSRVTSEIYGLLGSATLLGLAAGGYTYAAMWPASRLFGPALTAPPRPGELALTFDDGPNPACTPRLLDVLASHGVRAAFFHVGRYAQAEPLLVRRIAEAGHVIGNHSWSHPNLAFTSAADVREQLVRTSDTLAQIVGQPVRYFRPPFGGRRPYVLRVARELGMTPVLWNAITNDWSEPSADRIAQSHMRKIHRNQRRGYATTIVLHDGGHLVLNANRDPSVTAADLLISLCKHTHKFVSLDEWNRPG